MRKYVQFAAERIEYNNEVGAPTSPAAAVHLTIGIANITGRYLVENGNSQLVYEFTKGDRIRFIANPNYTLIPANPYFPPYVPPFVGTAGLVTDEITAFFPFNDTELTAGVPGVVSMIIDPANPTAPLNLLPGCLFEIYTPAQQVLNDNELTYEITEEGTLGYDAYGNWVHQASGGDQLIVPMTSSSFLGAGIYRAVVPVGHGLIIGDNVKFMVPNFFSSYGSIVAFTATTVDIDTNGFVLVGPAYNSGPGEVVRAAERTLGSGDCFRRLCDMPYEIFLTSTIYRLYSWIETSRASNVFTSDAADYGRPNRIDATIKRTTRESTAFWSEVFIPETDINGLSTVYLDTNFQSYDQRYGSIQKFFGEDMGLTMLQELKCGLIPIERLIYSDAAGNNTVGVSSTVMSPQVDYYQGEFGIGKNPESFAVYGTSKYFIDLNRGVVLRLSIDGLTPISNTGFMHNFFSDKCKEYLEANQTPQIFGVYDVKFNEYIIAFNEMVRPFPLPPISAETLAWNEKENQWSTFYSYNPEGMCSANTGIISFKDGALWKHNVNTVYNNFYGFQYPSEFWVICNANPSNVKILEAIGEETNAPWDVYEITTPNGQLSNILDTDFRELENNQYAPVLRDANTPNVVPPELPLFAGDVMRDRTFLAKFKYKTANYNKINAVDFQFIISNLHNIQ
jgi:hypothetical protein